MVQKLQIKLRDKELPPGPPQLRRPRRCPTGPSRLRVPRAPQHGPRRGAAALRPSAGPGPITRRYSPAEISPPRHRRMTPRGRSSHQNPLGPITALFAGNGGAGPEIPRGPGRAGGAKGAWGRDKAPPNTHTLAEGPPLPTTECTAPSLFPQPRDRGLHWPGPH